MAKPKQKSAKPKAAPRTPFLRILPALILVAVLMLSVRVNDIRKGILEAGTVNLGGELQAQQPKSRLAAPQPSPQQLAQAPGEQQAQGDKGKDAPPAPTPVAAPVAEQSNLTQTEMDVLQKLSDRRALLDAREKDIERREALQKAAESQIERKISEMKTLQSTIEGLLRQYNDQEDNKMRSLVKIYENMKPKEAAKIFEQLDMPIMLDVVERMKEQKVAPILAEMDPSKARAVTSELAQRRQIPIPKPSAGGG
ncbi:MAG: MotE family protein [Solirubrobacterales bacterium]